MRHLCVLFALTPLGALGCSEDGSGTSSALTYHDDTKAIIDARCATCHREGDIGPFPLTTFDEVKAFSGAVQASIENGTMPPWQPSDDCTSYLYDIDLTAEERETVLAWLDGGATEGEPTMANEAGADPDMFVADLSLQLPEPYTPVREPDDYRCQLIPWPADETRFVTGLRVTPDQRSIVHHVIVFVAGPDEVDQYLAYDEAEEGPGYTCYGGPRANTEGGAFTNIDPAAIFAALERMGLTVADLQSGNVTDAQLAELVQELGGGRTTGGFSGIGSWVPGVPAAPFPEGTGIRVEPGSMLVAQFHYNTLSSAPVADQSVIEIATAPSVEREATILAVLDIGWITNGLIGNPMTIPAGEARVEHATSIGFDSLFVSAARNTLGLVGDAPLVIHSANHHMHELGTTQRTELMHGDGRESCVLDIPDWDFSWQGSYTLANPVVMAPGDELRMGCTWNNSAANQPIIDGSAREPTDVAWGEGTSDEMCLGGYYVTGQ
ncbi:MAG: hypothetical protein AAGF12_14185 [Myxococcota bacterium]